MDRFVHQLVPTEPGQLHEENMERRKFLRYTATAPLGSFLLTRDEARADFTNILELVKLANPLFEVISLVEWIVNVGVDADRQTKANASMAKLQAVSEQVREIAANQKRITSMLAQSGLFSKQASDQSFFEKEVRDLHTSAQLFNLALVTDAERRPEKLRELEGVVARQAFGLAEYGVAGASGYIPAIALHNTCGAAIARSRTDFITINAAHSSKIHHMLNGSRNDKDTLAYIVTHEPDGSESALYGFDRKYALGIVSLLYEGADQPTCSYAVGVRFDGFSNGKPILNWFEENKIPGTYRGKNAGSTAIYGRRIISGEMWFGEVSSPNHYTFPQLIERSSTGEPYVESMLVNPVTRKLLYSEVSLTIINRQIREVETLYRNLCAGCGPNFTRDSGLQPITQAHTAMYSLLKSGLEQVNRIA